MPDLNRSLLSEGENADTLGGLTDVTITTPEEFQGLVYNGTGWVNGYSPLVQIPLETMFNHLYLEQEYFFQIILAKVQLQQSQLVRMYQSQQM